MLGPGTAERKRRPRRLPNRRRSRQRNRPKYRPKHPQRSQLKSRRQHGEPTEEPTEAPTVTPTATATGAAVTVNKLDETGDPLPGACFAGYRAAGGAAPAPENLVEERCDADDESADGRTVFRDVPAGDYLLVESQAPPGYVAADPTPFALAADQTELALDVDNAPAVTATPSPTEEQTATATSTDGRTATSTLTVEPTRTATIPTTAGSPSARGAPSASVSFRGLPPGGRFFFEGRPELQGSDFSCGNTVVYLSRIEVPDASGDFVFEIAFDRFSTGGNGDVGFGHNTGDLALLNVSINPGDPANSRPNGDERVSFARSQTADEIRATITITNLQPSETLVIRTEVRLECGPDPSRATGNVQATLSYGGGSQTVNLCKCRR